MTILVAKLKWLLAGLENYSKLFATNQLRSRGWNLFRNWKQFTATKDPKSILTRGLIEAIISVSKMTSNERHYLISVHKRTIANVSNTQVVQVSQSCQTKGLTKQTKHLLQALKRRSIRLKLLQPAKKTLSNSILTQCSAKTSSFRRTNSKAGLLI